MYQRLLWASPELEAGDGAVRWNAERRTSLAAHGERCADQMSTWVTNSSRRLPALRRTESGPEGQGIDHKKKETGLGVPLLFLDFVHDVQAVQELLNLVMHFAL